MTTTPDRSGLFEFMPYGAPELKEVARKYMVRAIFVSSAAWVAVYALGFGGSQLISHRPKETSVIVVPYREISAPPPLSNDTPPPQVAVATSVAAPAAAIPVPVPDAEAPMEQTIKSQEEIAAATPSMASQDDKGQSIVVAPPTDEDLPKYGEYVYVEELPEAITKVAPQYPDLAREASVDGTVMVQALVGKDGTGEGHARRQVHPDARRRGGRGGPAVGLQAGALEQQAGRGVGRRAGEVHAALGRSQGRGRGSGPCGVDGGPRQGPPFPPGGSPSGRAGARAPVPGAPGLALPAPWARVCLAGTDSILSRRSPARRCQPSGRQAWRRRPSPWRHPPRPNPHSRSGAAWWRSSPGPRRPGPASSAGASGGSRCSSASLVSVVGTGLTYQRALVPTMLAQIERQADAGQIPPEQLDRIEQPGRPARCRWRSTWRRSP